MTGLRERLRALVSRVTDDGSGCSHLDQARMVEPLTDGCEACLRDGMEWVHLRLCLACGYVGCCNSSVGRHAYRHFEGTGHPIVRSHEPGETWSWCWIDEVEL